MKPFHWVPVKDAVVLKSIWKDHTDEKIDLDRDSLDSLFGAKEALKPAADQGRTHPTLLC